MIGWIGMALLLFAYIILISKWSKWFIPIDIVASAFLTTHAIILQDIPFLVVNGFITVLLTYKYFVKKERTI